MRSLCLSLCPPCSSSRYSPVHSPSSMPSTDSSVDLPAPDGPMMVTKSPCAISSETRRNTYWRPPPSGKDLSRSWIAIILLVPQRDHRIDARSASRRQIAGDQHCHCDYQG